MLGGDKPETVGMIPRALTEIFAHIATQKHKKEFKVTVSAVEIYNEQLKDLLNTTAAVDLRIIEHKTQGVSIKNLTNLTVETVNDVTSLLELAVASRVVAATQMNATRYYSLSFSNSLARIPLARIPPSLARIPCLRYSSHPPA